MWPFLKRQRQSADRSGEFPAALEHRPRPMKFAQLLDGMGDFSDFKNHDAALKFWLPEPASEALEELSSRNGDSMSEALRQFFATHCYGLYAFQVMKEAIPELFKEPGPESIMFSRRWDEPPPNKKRVDTYWVPELGKNIAPIKVWIPARMRGDLQALADHVGIKLSQYAREIVISRLLGHGTLPKRPEMMSAAPLPSVEDWCEDRDVPMRQVDAKQYYRVPDGKVRTEWVDI